MPQAVSTFGVIYNLLAGLVSLAAAILVNHILGQEAVRAIFDPSNAVAGATVVSLILASVLAEAFGVVLIVKRTRGRLHQEVGLASGGEIPGKTDTSDGYFLMILSTIVFRCFYSGLLGVQVGAMLGEPAAGGALGLGFLVKDFFLFKAATDAIRKPISSCIPRWQSLAADGLLTFSGLVAVSLGWGALMSRLGPHLSPLHRGPAPGDLFISALALVILYFTLIRPTRLGFHLEEMTLADTAPERRILLRSTLASMAFSILPWLL